MPEYTDRKIPKLPPKEDADLRAFLMEQAEIGWNDIRDEPFGEEEAAEASRMIDRIIDVVAVATQGMEEGGNYSRQEISDFILVANQSAAILKTMGMANELQLHGAGGLGDIFGVRDETTIN